MTVLDGLKGINDYPIKSATFNSVATKRGLTLTGELTSAIMDSEPYELATADIYVYLVYAPNISQGGVSVSFNEEQRENFLTMANTIYAKWSETDSINGVVYGYKGSDL